MFCKDIAISFTLNPITLRSSLLIFIFVTFYRWYTLMIHIFFDKCIFSINVFCNFLYKNNTITKYIQNQIYSWPLNLLAIMSIQCLINLILLTLMVTKYSKIKIFLFHPTWPYNQVVIFTGKPFILLTITNISSGRVKCFNLLSKYKVLDFKSFNKSIVRKTETFFVILLWLWIHFSSIINFKGNDLNLSTY